MANMNNAFGVTIGINPGTGLAAPVYTHWTALFADMHALGLTWLRFQIPWRNIELTQGVYDWTAMDDAVSHCNAQGVNIMGTINDAPTFYLATASQKASSEPFYLMDPTGAATFATAFLSRYNGGAQGHLDAIGFNENANIHNTSPNDTLVLNQTITNAGGPYTALTIQAAAQTADVGTLLYLAGINNLTDVATVSSAVAVGDTSVAISSFTPAVSYSPGQVISVAYVATNNSPYSLYNPGSGGVTTKAKAEPARDGHFASPVFNAVAVAVRALNATIPLGLPLAWWPQPINGSTYPGSPSNYTAFFQDMFTNCAAHIDAQTFLDFHFYPNKVAPQVGSPQVSTIAQAISDLQAVAASNGHTGMPIWCTEFGWQVPQDTDAITQAANYQTVLQALIPSPNTHGNKAFFFTLLYGSVGNGSSLVLIDGSHQPAYATVQAYTGGANSLTNKYGGFMVHA